jgi:hypothetical protein
MQIAVSFILNTVAKTNTCGSLMNDFYELLIEERSYKEMQEVKSSKNNTLNL